VLTLYIIFLILCTSVVALKTRKLRQKNFQDAKKVNVFLFLIMLIGILGLALYYVTLNLGMLLVSLTILHITHCTFIGLCLVFLFVPKLYPVITRKHYEKLNYIKTFVHN